MSAFSGYLVFLFACFAATFSGAAERQVLQQRLAELTGTFQVVGDFPATNRLHATLCLPLRNAAELSNLLGRMYDPRSPDYRHYLTPSTFTEQFGPSKDDYAAVVTFAQAQGLTVSATHSNRTLVELAGTTADFERAFHLRLCLYRHPQENRIFHAPDRTPSIDLAVPVLSISGLDDYSTPRAASIYRATAPQGVSTNGSGPNGTLMGSDFRKAYASGVTNTGSGQSVGLVEFDGFYTNDIIAYENKAGLPNVPLQTVLLDNFNGAPGVKNDEVAQDIEMAIAMAPGLSKVIVYEGTAPLDILSQMASDNTAKQLSCSWTWGLPEPGMDAIFQQFAAQGQSFFQAAGDCDAYTGPIPSPADNPYVTVVAGTTLTTAPNGTWVSEKVWNDWGAGIGSGGGISTRYPIPSWQTNINMTANHGSTTMRNIPDVAMVADNIFIIANNGQSLIGGGTSAAAPLWAGYTALMNQQALAIGHPILGFLNPVLYARATVSSYSNYFHDITMGNNCNAGSPSNYCAIPGYDLCTGLGSPTGQPLFNSFFQNLVQNGGFETGTFANWTQSGYATISTNSDYAHTGGTYGARLAGNGKIITILSYLSQTVNTVSGQYYQISFWVNCPHKYIVNKFQVLWNGTTALSQQRISGPGWENIQINNLQATGSTCTLQFGFNLDTAFGDYLGLDDIMVFPYP